MCNTQRRAVSRANACRGAPEPCSKRSPFTTGPGSTSPAPLVTPLLVHTAQSTREHRQPAGDRCASRRADAGSDRRRDRTGRAPGNGSPSAPDATWRSGPFRFEGTGRGRKPRGYRRRRHRRIPSEPAGRRRLSSDSLPVGAVGPISARMPDTLHARWHADTGALGNRACAVHRSSLLTTDRAWGRELPSPPVPGTGIVVLRRIRAVEGHRGPYHSVRSAVPASLPRHHRRPRSARSRGRFPSGNAQPWGRNPRAPRESHKLGP